MSTSKKSLEHGCVLKAFSVMLFIFVINYQKDANPLSMESSAPVTVLASSEAR